MEKPRLSGFNYRIVSWSRTVYRGEWEYETSENIYSFCPDPNACRAPEEHEYAFDGQCYYKKKVANGNR